MVLKCSQNIHVGEFSKIRPLHLCKNRELGMCRRTRKSIAHHSPEAELRSLRQGWWVQGGVEVCAGKVSMLFRTKTVRSHPVTQAHTVSKPFSSIIWSWIHLWLLCVQKPLSLSDPSWLPHSVASPPLGSGSCVGEPRLSQGAKLLIGTSTWNTAALWTMSSFGGDEFCHCWPSVFKWSCYVT